MVHDMTSDPDTCDSCGGYAHTGTLGDSCKHDKYDEAESATGADYVDDPFEGHEPEDDGNQHEPEVAQAW